MCRDSGAKANERESERVGALRQGASVADPLGVGERIGSSVLFGVAASRSSYLAQSFTRATAPALPRLDQRGTLARADLASPFARVPEPQTAGNETPIVS